jgi:colanic acid/amylovoran biosynthesis glycosyltransferase
MRPMPLHIAYMTGEYPRATDTFIQREVAALRAAGHQVETFSIRKPHSKEAVSDTVKAESARTFYVLSSPKIGIIGSHLRMLKSPGRYLAGIKTALAIRPPGLKAMVRQLAYFVEAGVVADRVNKLGLQHLHNHFANSSCSVATIAAAMGGFTFSFTMHGPAEFFEPKYWFIGEKIRRALFVNCISWFCRSQAMVFAPPQCWPRMHVIHCGVDPAEFSTPPNAGSDVLRRPGFSAPDPGLRSTSDPACRLLFVGRLAAVKGLPILIDALRSLVPKIPGIELVVAGDGPDRASLEKLAAGLPVRFLGYQSQTQVRDLLREAAAFVLPSFAEGVPVVLMEAMAAGVPVVATRIAGIPELVEDGVTGLLVPPGDAASLVDAMVRLLGDESLRARLIPAARTKVADKFNIHAESARLVAVMTAALAGNISPVRVGLQADGQ